MYKVTARYELRKYPDLSGKLGYLEIGDVVDGWTDGDNLRVTTVNGIYRFGYFPLIILEPFTPEPDPIPVERYVLYVHDGIVEKFVPEA